MASRTGRCRHWARPPTGDPPAADLSRCAGPARISGGACGVGGFSDAARIGLVPPAFGCRLDAGDGLGFVLAAAGALGLAAVAERAVQAEQDRQVVVEVQPPAGFGGRLPPGALPAVPQHGEPGDRLGVVPPVRAPAHPRVAGYPMQEHRGEVADHPYFQARVQRRVLLLGAGRVDRAICGRVGGGDRFLEDRGAHRVLPAARFGAWVGAELAGRLPADWAGGAVGWCIPSGYHSPASCAAVRAPDPLAAALAVSRLASAVSRALRGIPTAVCSSTPAVAGSSGMAASARPWAISRPARAASASRSACAAASPPGPSRASSCAYAAG